MVQLLEVKAIRGIRGIKDSKAIRGTKDTKGIRDTKGIKDIKGVKDIKDTKGIRDTKVQGTKAIKGTKEKLQNVINAHQCAVAQSIIIHPDPAQNLSYLNMIPKQLAHLITVKLVH